MNVLYVGNFEFPDKSPGALKVLSFAKILRNLGHNVDFASTYKGDGDCKKRKYSYDNFLVYSYKKNNSLKEFFVKLYDIKLFKYVASKKKYSLIIAYNPQSIANLRMSNWCKKNHIKYVCDIDEWDEPSPQYNWLIKLCVKFNIWLNMTFSNKKADGLILSSTYLDNYYKKMHTLVCPPLVDMKEDKWSKIEHNNKDDHSFVYFGSGGSAKEDLKTIIDNIEGIKNCVLNVVGLTQETYEKDYHIKHKEYNNIKFWGRVEHTTALSIVANSKCSIIIRKPTRKNNAGFPTKFVESISLGIPVLCNEFSDVKRYFINNQNGKILDLHNIKDGLVSFFDYDVVVDQDTFDISKYYERFDDFINNL